MPIFLFTDIEGSTHLWQKYPGQMNAVLARHDNLLCGLVEKHGGRVVKNTGDGLFAVFELGEPLACALEIEKQIACEDWDPLGELRVRVALHIGEAVQRGNDYFGLDVNRAFRLLTAGWGGQILLTCELARSILQPPAGASLHDLGIHTLKDLSEPQHIFGLDHPELPIRTFPPLRTLSSHPHNLPPQSTPFVGRASELTGIASRLADPACRLLTLVGPGGIGKTRLALQSAAGQVEAFRHGVYFVPLAPLASADLLIPAIAEALNFTFYQRDNPGKQLLNYLREKNILLVMDNFEHLTASAGWLSEILVASPQTKILTTSRERLNLREEQVFQVDGMYFPSQHQEEKGLEEFSSVKLFLQSARRTLPGFDLAPEELACVARICRLVQGTPLGIEMAAGWLRSLSCQEIANEIEASLDFLETNLRDVPDRHRSLRAVFDYSWDLLTEAERQTLARLSVFQGAFQRETIDAIMDMELGAPKQALLSLLSALVDKSLLRRNTDNTYELHSLMCGYARERLEADPQVAARTRNLHASYFINLLARSEPALHGREQPKAMRQVAACMDDIRAAWLWTLSQGQWQKVEAGLDSLYLFFDLRSREEDGMHFFREARTLLTRYPGAGSERLSLRMDIRFAAVCVAVSQFEEARPLLETSLAVARQMGLPIEVALIHTIMGRIAWIEGDYKKSILYERQALDAYRQLQRTADVALCLDRLGTSAWSMGDYVSAHQFLQESLGLLKPDGAPGYLARILDHLGVVARDNGDQESALTYFQESQEKLDGLDVAGQLVFVTNHLAGIMLMTGHAVEAAAQFEYCIALSREIGHRRALAYNLHDLGGIELNIFHNPEKAGALFEESHTIFEAIGERFGEILTCNGQAGAAFAAGKKGDGLEKLKRSLNESIKIQNTRLIIETIIVYADFLNQQQRFTEAAELLGFLTADSATEACASIRENNLVENIRSALPAEMMDAALVRGHAFGLDEIRSRLERE